MCSCSRHAPLPDAMARWWASSSRPVQCRSSMKSLPSAASPLTWTFSVPGDGGMSDILLIALLCFACVTGSVLLLARPSSGFIDRYRSNFMDQARVNLADMFLFVDPRVLFRTNVLMLLAIPVLVWIVTGGNLLLPILALILRSEEGRVGK